MSCRVSGSSSTSLMVRMSSCAPSLERSGGATGWRAALIVPVLTTLTTGGSPTWVGLGGRDGGAGARTAAAAGTNGICGPLEVTEAVVAGGPLMTDVSGGEGASISSITFMSGWRTSQCVPVPRLTEGLNS